MINSGLLSNMVNGGEKGHNLNQYQSRLIQIEVENNFMEMERRAYMDLQRNTNEDFKTQVTIMERAGVKNHFQNFRTDSEELFKSWITNGESHSLNSTSMGHRTPQTFGRMSAELNLYGQHLGSEFQNETSQDTSPQITHLDEENSINLDQNSIRNVAERGVPASNSYPAKAWFQRSQPMTRSRSSELRRNYATVQNFQTSPSMEVVHEISGPSINIPKQELTNRNGFSEGSFCSILNQNGTFVSPLNSSLSPFNEKRDSEDRSLEVYGVQEVLGDMCLDQNGQRSYQNVHSRTLQAIDRPEAPGFDGFDTVDGPLVNASQTIATTCESPIQVVNRRNRENGTMIKAMDYITITDDQKSKERLLRSGSVTSSADLVDEGETTKKRRVERSRKMAEAKERISTPVISSDMQSIVKRCENLEKEVRSLKLNLAFMNRKDSEQTKQLEELQVQHEELMEEKDRLLEEIERILTARGNM